MFLNDFGNSGVHFLMIFEARELIFDAWRDILTMFYIFVISCTFSVRKPTSFLR